MTVAEIARLEALLEKASSGEGDWGAGEYGSCDLVAYNGEDVVGIAVVRNEARIALIAAMKNALPELLKLARDGERLHRLMEHATTIEVDGADYVTFSINWNYTQLLPDYNEDEPDSALRAAIDDAMKEASRG